ncbi:TPR repeat [Carex littledalei]|uniref:TPR repeat n=1 Tax=Carex littledalei TaxID=544730 RepID=A0A833VIQ0_9POAL|nr:TPR repeat [Carex littledalei]
MLLRSASTPLLGSLLSSSSHFLSSDSPASVHNHIQPFPASCHLSSPAFSDISNHSNSSFIRRTLSDGNLCSLLSEHPDEHHHVHQSQRPNPVLEAIPSFSVCESAFDEYEELAELEGVSDLSFLDENRSAGTAGPPLFLARGLGIDRIGSGLLSAGGDGNGRGRGRGCNVKTDGGNQSDLELYYKRMVEQHPTDPLFLRNYALFLYQVKNDFQRAEEYYSRAILADPSDGETLSKYASLIWELHHDEERANSYFQQAVQASPDNSYVLAAQAGFLWDIDEDTSAEEENSNGFHNFSGYASHVGEMVSTAS